MLDNYLLPLLLQLLPLLLAALPPSLLTPLLEISASRKCLPLSSVWQINQIVARSVASAGLIYTREKFVYRGTQASYVHSLYGAYTRLHRLESFAIRAWVGKHRYRRTEKFHLSRGDSARKLEGFSAGRRLARSPPLGSSSARWDSIKMNKPAGSVNLSRRCANEPILLPATCRLFSHPPLIPLSTVALGFRGRWYYPASFFKLSRRIYGTIDASLGIKFRFATCRFDKEREDQEI